MLVFGRETTCNFGFLYVHTSRHLSNNIILPTQTQVINNSGQITRKLPNLKWRALWGDSPTITTFWDDQLAGWSLFYWPMSIQHGTPPLPPKSHNTSRRIIHCLKHGAKVELRPPKMNPSFLVIFLSSFWKNGGNQLEISWRIHGMILCVPIYLSTWMGRFYERCG